MLDVFSRFLTVSRTTQTCWWKKKKKSYFFIPSRFLHLLHVAFHEVAYNSFAFVYVSLHFRSVIFLKLFFALKETFFLFWGFWSFYIFVVLLIFKEEIESEFMRIPKKANAFLQPLQFQLDFAKNNCAHTFLPRSIFFAIMYLSLHMFPFMFSNTEFIPSLFISLAIHFSFFVNIF